MKAKVLFYNKIPQGREIKEDRWIKRDVLEESDAPLRLEVKAAGEFKAHRKRGKQLGLSATVLLPFSESILGEQAKKSTA